MYVYMYVVTNSNQRALLCCAYEIAKQKTHTQTYTCSNMRLDKISICEGYVPAFRNHPRMLFIPPTPFYQASNGDISEISILYVLIPKDRSILVCLLFPVNILEFCNKFEYDIVSIAALSHNDIPSPYFKATALLQVLQIRASSEALFSLCSFQLNFI